MKQLLLTTFFALILIASPADAKPNVLLILVADMGYSDLGKDVTN